jgi:hypothetical protein
MEAPLSLHAFLKDWHASHAVLRVLPVHSRPLSLHASQARGLLLAVKVS